jgi:disulfide bond formation protein DsbB
MRVFYAFSLLLSATLLGGALFFQYGMGLAPCELCLWQRYPHIGIIILAGLGLMAQTKMASNYHKSLIIFICILQAIALFLAVYHSGIEYGLWQGMTACTTTITATDKQALLEAIMNARVIRCDEVPWRLLGLSMATWHSVIMFLSLIANGMLWSHYLKIFRRSPFNA